MDLESMLRYYPQENTADFGADVEIVPENERFSLGDRPFSETEETGRLQLGPGSANALYAHPGGGVVFDKGKGFDAVP